LARTLCDQGAEVGCYSNRYVQHIDANGRPVEKSFGISHWHSLADLERWAASHPTHLQIFGMFLKKVPELPNLRLYHEVSVFDAAGSETCGPDFSDLTTAWVRPEPTARSLCWARFGCRSALDSWV
jgi:hypothetical protein